MLSFYFRKLLFTYITERAIFCENSDFNLDVLFSFRYAITVQKWTGISPTPTQFWHYWPFASGIQQSAVVPFTKRQNADLLLLLLLLLLGWTNCWTNRRDLRRHATDVTIINWEARVQNYRHAMMTSSNGNFFPALLAFVREFTGYRLIPLTKASDTELLCLLWSEPEQTAVQTIETPVIRDAIALIMTSQ